MQEFKTQQIKSALKVLLKKKGITYEELAESMECSVPTIKRILGPEELTLSRLLDLCDIVGIDLGELQTLIGENAQVEEAFTEEQQIFLTKNRSHFAYFLKLLDGKTPKQIADSFNLSPRSTDKYLIALEKHELIRVTGKQKVKPNFNGIPLVKKGPLAKTYFESFIRSGTDFFINAIHEALSAAVGEEKVDAKFGTHVAKVSKASYANWIKEKEKLMRELTNICSYEEKTIDESQLETVVVIDANALVRNDHHGLKTLENILGNITNI